MRFLSLCSGIEAASLAFNPLGWQTVAVAEVHPFCRAVLAHRLPQVVNRGDITRFMEWPDDDAIDLVCGGTPCQSYSAAGLRAGLADPRGDLMLTFLAVAARYRPRWVVWENVAGVLFTNRGRDFGTFLGLLAHIGYGFSYRVFDAQYFGLAQRRRRVFVVGHLGDWHPAAAVLFDAASLRGHPAPRRAQGQDVAAAAGAGPAAGEQPYEVANVLTRRMWKGINTTADEGQTPVIAFPAFLSATQRLSAEGLAPALGSVNRTAVTAPTGVRLLTPREAERLQGLPDDWTLVPYRGRMAKDTPRYEAIGNSWPVPVAQWIGRRVGQVHGLTSAVAHQASEMPSTDDYRKKVQESGAKKTAAGGAFSEGKGQNFRLFQGRPYKGLE